MFGWVDGRKLIEGDTGGDDDNYGEESTMGLDGLDRDLGGSDGCVVVYPCTENGTSAKLRSVRRQIRIQNCCEFLSKTLSFISDGLSAFAFGN